MNYRELLEKYHLLLDENRRLAEENDRLKEQLRIAENKFNEIRIVELTKGNRINNILR